MNPMPKDIPLINDRIKSGEVRVYTEMEVKEALDRGESMDALDADVVTMAFQSSMSGTSAMLLVPVTSRGVFTRAGSIWLNGLDGYPGPAPNERLGMVDTLIFADRRCRERPSYSGADLILDMLKDTRIQSRCLSIEGDLYDSSFFMRQLEFARLYVFNAFIPPTRWNPPFSEGDANAHVRAIRTGSKVLLNGAKGIVVGTGTRDTSGKKSLSLTADMHEMEADAPGIIEVAEGLPLANSIALALPVTGRDVMESIASYLGRLSRNDSGGAFHDTDLKMASRLKDLIRTGSFMLTESDFVLGEQMPGSVLAQDRPDEMPRASLQGQESR